MGSGPIMLAGVDRSGKTLLRLMLDAHPRIAMSRRANLWPYLYNRFGDLGAEANFERCLETLLRSKSGAQFQPDLPRLRREFQQGEPSYGRLFALLHSQYAEQRGKPRWGDQTGLIERYTAPIFAATPDARFIHLLRDPRDRFEAVYARQERRAGALGRSAAMWRYSIELGAANLRRYPERYLLVRYEDLVRAPEPTLRRICAFIDEPYLPALLRMAAPDEPAEPKGPLSPAYIGRYRQALTASETAVIERYTGPLMRTYGYQPEQAKLTASEAARFVLADWPLGLASAWGWLARERFQLRFAARLGRKPGPKRAFAHP